MEVKEEGREGRRERWKEGGTEGEKRRAGRGLPLFVSFV